MLHDFTREDIDKYLRLLGKEYRKIAGKSMRAEIVLIGGSAVITNYHFRFTTTDIDALIEKGSLLQEAIRRVANENDLPVDWMNSDFMYTSSYSDQLRRYSKYYKTFYNVLEVRTISGEYLVAMKLKSSRYYTHDVSDVVGIFRDQIETGAPLSFQMIMKAYENLYGSIDDLDQDTLRQVQKYSNMNDEELDAEYQKNSDAEQSTASELKMLDQQYPDAVNAGSVDKLSKELFKKLVSSDDHDSENDGGNLPGHEKR